MPNVRCPLISPIRLNDDPDLIREALGAAKAGINTDITQLLNADVLSTGGTQIITSAGTHQIQDGVGVVHVSGGVAVTLIMPPHIAGNKRLLTISNQQGLTGGAITVNASGADRFLIAGESSPPQTMKIPLDTVVTFLAVDGAKVGTPGFTYWVGVSADRRNLGRDATTSRVLPYANDEWIEARVAGIDLTLPDMTDQLGCRWTIVNVSDGPVTALAAPGNVIISAAGSSTLMNVSAGESRSFVGRHNLINNQIGWILESDHLSIPAALQASLLSKKRIEAQRQGDLNTGTTVGNIGVVSLNIIGTATALNDDTGSYVSYESLPITDSDAGWTTGIGQTKLRYRPILHSIFKTGPNASDLEDVLIQIGFLAGPYSVRLLYDTREHDTPVWRARISNALSVTEQEIETITLDTRYELIIDCSRYDTTGIDFWLNGHRVLRADPGEWNFPDKDLDFRLRMHARTLANAAKHFRCSMFRLFYD